MSLSDCVCVSLSPDAQFVRVAPLSETDNPEDDKVYVFFTERAQEAEGAAGKVLYSRVARVCKVWSAVCKRKTGCFCWCFQRLHVVYVKNIPAQTCGACTCWSVSASVCVFVCTSGYLQQGVYIKVSIDAPRFSTAVTSKYLYCVCPPGFAWLDVCVLE